MKLRTKLPLMVAVIAVTLGAMFAVWMHFSTQAAIRDEARASVVGLLDVNSRDYLASGISTELATLDDPDAPAELLRRAGDGELVSWLDDSSGDSWAAVPAAGGRVLVVRSTWTSGLDVLRRVDRNLTLGVLALTALSSLAAFAATRTVSRRLRLAETAAAAIAAGDLDIRVSEAVRRSGRAEGRPGRPVEGVPAPPLPPESGDEVARLARTIDDLTTAMQERLAAEKRVTADIAHDLRTPITGLLAAASLLPDGRPTELIQSQIARLRYLVEDLLEVARLDEAHQHLDAQSVTTQALAARAVSAAEVADCQLVVVKDADVTTDPRRVERILVNQLTNAVTHGAAPVTCTVDGATITIADSGTGFPVDLVREGPRRFRTGATERGRGHGLGLTIAAGQAKAIGAELTFTNDPDTGGARASLVLPVTPHGGSGGAD